MRRLAFVILALPLAPAAVAAPFVPVSDHEVLERLPFARRDPVMRDLAGLQAQLKEDPGNLTAAARLARGFLELSRAAGDPRYVGYAQAALAPWWDEPHPPLDVLMLRATARQRVHKFDEALADLRQALALDPRNAQAHLTRAVVLQVTGAFGPALESCARLTGANLRLIRMACLANAAGATGRLRESYDSLADTLAQSPSADSAILSWIETMLGEMAERLGDAPTAERRFREALGRRPDDAYLLAAYADFLLDQKRPAEVERLLEGKERIDPLLLRLALAARLAGAETLAARVAQLRERFEASRLRGDTAHLREEARFALHLLDDPARASRLALENWRVQKEPADLRILLEAARAAGDDGALRAARAWIAETRLEDSRLAEFISKAEQPN